MNISRPLIATSLSNRHLRRLSSAVDDRRSEVALLSDNGLTAAYQTLLQQHQAKSDSFRFTDQTLTHSTALAVEALRRKTGLLAYDVQIQAGLTMARGAIAEMQTGEGKTLSSMFPIVAFALVGSGVHVATVNSYLAQRDSDFLKPSLNLLGLTVGVSNSGDPVEQKRDAYAADVTFATGYEFGFDFLRDQIAMRSRASSGLGVELRRRLFGESETRARPMQRGFAAAIVDEVDSVFIDEASTPLVLSSGSLGRDVDDSVYFTAKSAAAQLRDGIDFQLNSQAKSVRLTEGGNATIHSVDTLNSAQSRNLLRPWRQYIESALRAKHLMVRDVHYVVNQDSNPTVIEIVDEFTGRIFSDRKWRDGLHQAVEAKEGVAITEERQTIAKISRQRYFQRYEVLSGMTGTAEGHQSEFRSCYRTPVVMIPRRKKLLRQQLPTRYFGNESDKTKAIVAAAITSHQSNQPVLICTRTIRQSKILAALLRADEKLGQAATINVLNGVQDEDEAALVAQAGVAGTITVATNMAGRGTDIKPDSIALAAGGLHVIGFEHSESQRIDRQLIGRSARQGDPGSFQFFASADDQLIRQRDAALAEHITRIAPADGTINKKLDHRIVRLQNAAEADAYKIRRGVMREELWLDKIKKVAG
jgi:preprotein translocase subunit SecA